MRIWDNGGDAALYDVLLMLTRTEAERLRGAVEQMLSDEEKGDYPIVDLDDNSKHYSEFAVCLYDETNIENNNYCDRMMQLIREGE